MENVLPPFYEAQYPVEARHPYAHFSDSHCFQPSQGSPTFLHAIHSVKFYTIVGFLPFKRRKCLSVPTDATSKPGPQIKDREKKKEKKRKGGQWGLPKGTGRETRPVLKEAILGDFNSTGKKFHITGATFLMDLLSKRSTEKLLIAPLVLCR